MGTISKDFSYKEFEHTDYAEFKYQNMIRDVAVRDSVKALVDNVLQPLRDAWGRPLLVNSGFRCPELNAKVGGVPTSQHLKGEAADIAPNISYATVNSQVEIARLAKSLGLPFDQMILYPTFVHFSHRLNGKQRGQVLYSKTWKGGEI